MDFSKQLFFEALGTNNFATAWEIILKFIISEELIMNLNNFYDLILLIPYQNIVQIKNPVEFLQYFLKNVRILNQKFPIITPYLKWLRQDCHNPNFKDLNHFFSSWLKKNDNNDSGDDVIDCLPYIINFLPEKLLFFSKPLEISIREVSRANTIFEVSEAYFRHATLAEFILQYITSKEDSIARKTLMFIVSNKFLVSTVCQSQDLFNSAIQSLENSIKIIKPFFDKIQPNESSLAHAIHFLSTIPNNKNYLFNVMLKIENYPYYKFEKAYPVMEYDTVQLVEEFIKQNQLVEKNQGGNAALSQLNLFFSEKKISKQISFLLMQLIWDSESNTEKLAVRKFELTKKTEAVDVDDGISIDKPKRKLFIENTSIEMNNLSRSAEHSPTYLNLH